ncbi:fasciclin domain-containing protein [Rhabdothermincola salaria]|uniref:fasciclin domain-containing protein n=1 Tax=Rhabdothermincola salaria TaxID=2903142 RepID=UPI001E56E77E|nr:fasciclin domain-containing protein [Rhabdothermincola salaria]MCD9624400.1 fasciclin domain-containing protein [Rhabdothermincola salaria]
MKKILAVLVMAAIGLGLLAAPAAARGGKPGVVPGKPGAATIYDIASGSDSFTTLTALLDLSGLDAAVQQTDSKLTVFAPTDGAFAKLPAECVTFLTSPEGADTLEAVLLYHVTDGRRFSNSVFGQNAKTVPMLAAGSITANPDLTLTDGAGQTVGVTTPFNVNASNGVIHAIDTVLLPFVPACAS